MRNRNFMEMLSAKQGEGKSVCVGLDSELDKIPKVVQFLHRIGNTITVFNRAIVEATQDLVCAYKPNLGFYVAYGTEGLEALRVTISDIHDIASSVPVILDAKFGDIGNTSALYAQMAFDYLQADAVTVHPYLGVESLQPFLCRIDKGIFVLCHTTNPGAGEFQDLQIQMGPILVNDEPMSRPIYQIVAENVAHKWNKNGNCALVVGATYPKELAEVRRIVGDMPILIPGIGAQGGDVEKTVPASKDSRGQGMIINASRSIILASSGADFAEAARRETLKLHNLINQYR